MKSKLYLRAFGFATCIGCLPPQSASAQSFFDNGGGDNLWSNNLNWNGDAPPSGNIAIAGGLTAISNGNVSLSIGDLTIGADGSFGLNAGPAGDGTLEVTAGTFSTSIGMRLGVAATTTTGTLTVKNTGTVDITAGNLLAGNFNGIAATGVINVQTGGTLNLSTTGLQRIGHGSSGTLNISGGTMNQSNAMLEITAAGALNGAFNMSAGTLNVNQEMRVGNAFSITTATHSGGTINKLATQVGNYVVGANSAPVNYSHTGGTLNVEDGAGSFILGWNSGDVEGFGGQVYTLNGGDINIGQTSSTGLRIGLGAFKAVMNVQSGNLTIGVGSGIGLRMGEDFNGVGNAILNVSGGTVTVNSGNMFVGVQNTVNGNSSGLVTQTGGTVTLAPGQTLWVGAPFTTAVGTYNLNGGTLVTNSFGIGSPNGAINWGSGTLQNNGNMTFNSSVNMTDTGIWDTAGYTATQLAGVDMSGTGGLTKTGAGTLVLQANNSYSGTTSVNTGTLLVDGALTGAGAVNVASNAGIGGNGDIYGNLSIAAGGKFAFIPASTLGVVGSVVIDGTFGVASLVNADLTAVDWSAVAPDTYPLIDTTPTDFSTLGIQNWGVANAYNLGGGKSAYFETQGGADLVLVVVSGGANYSSWASAFTSPALSNTASTADPDYDGLTNAMEYALGLDPRFSSASPGVASNGGKTITFTKGAEAKVNGDVTYQIETSISLGAAPNPWTLDVTNVTEDVDTISITFPAGPLKNFARLKVTLAP